MLLPCRTRYDVRYWMFLCGDVSLEVVPAAEAAGDIDITRDYRLRPPREEPEEPDERELPLVDPRLLEPPLR